MVPFLEQDMKVLIVLAHRSAGTELHVATLLIGLVHSCVIMGFANSRFFFYWEALANIGNLAPKPMREQKFQTGTNTKQ